jgi:two-component system, OmpR family, response regulator
MRLLLVEDDPDLASAHARTLVEDHFAVDVSHDGRDALFRLLSIDYDIVVLDLMLPGRDGLSVLKSLREAGRAMPVLILTARDSVEDRVHGLNLGADDYLTKPFAVAELLARLAALLRRTAGQSSPEVTAGDIRVDLTTRRVHRGAAEVDLTPREYGILELLLRRRGAIVTRTEIATSLYSDESEVVSNAIDVHVASLRRKLGADLVQTRRGHGYLIEA